MTAVQPVFEEFSKLLPGTAARATARDGRGLLVHVETDEEGPALLQREGHVAGERTDPAGAPLAVLPHA